MSGMRERRIASLLVLVLVTACGSPRARPVVTAPAGRTTVVIEGVPHVQQEPDFCGEACVEMVAQHLGSPLDQDDVFALSGVDPAEGRGAYTSDLKRALVKVGFDVGDVWHPIDPAHRAADLDAQFTALYDDLAKGIPSIVCMHYDDRPNTTEHFRLILGYDAATDEVVYHEPAVEDGAYQRMPRARFLMLWPLHIDKGQWSAIRFRLLPGGPLHAKVPGAAETAALVQHVRALRAKLPDEFTVVVETPFVVIGDGPAGDVRAAAKHTVKWAVDRLKREYFEKDPGATIDVYLFDGKSSYEGYTRLFFHERPPTPFGYYSPTHQALIMNIATGGGTLVHEIVHPYMAANFPDVPVWFNEGMASLYEQSHEDDDGRIMGLTNWRLDGLKRGLRKHVVPSFRALMAMTDDEFRDADEGLHYAEARYLLYYLQEKGLLHDYYRQFRAHAAADPTGYATLTRVLGQSEGGDMKTFQATWSAWVLGLTFP